MYEVIEVEVDLVLEVVVVEEDTVGVNGKEYLMLYSDCIKYNPDFISTECTISWVQENILVCQVISFCRLLRE
jgi:hypothetical protein